MMVEYLVMRHNRLFRAIPWLLILLSFSVMVTAMAQAETCEPAAKAAFEALAQSCASAPGSSACYGSSAGVGTGDGGTATFAKAGDTVPLSSLQSVHTTATDSAWGSALLNVQGNVPLAVSEQGLKYILIGGLEVENAVPADSAFTPSQAVTVKTLVAANLRSAPNTDAQVIASAPVGTELKADGISADKSWLRVSGQDIVAWVSRQVVAPTDGKLDDLPKIDSKSLTLMQSIFLRPMGDTAPTCGNLPASTLLVQSPAGTKGSIRVNGVDIRFESSIAIRLLDAKTMQIVALDGSAVLGTASLPAGFSLTVPLSEDGNTPGGAPGGLRPLNDDERAFLGMVGQNIPNGMLYNPMSIPTKEQVAAVQRKINQSVVGSASSGPAAGKADCSRFKPTSPLDGLAFGITPFYWDAAPGATSYRLTIVGEDGSQRTSTEVGSFTTTLSVDTGNSLGDGTNFTWSVQALVNGQVACTSSSVTIPRAGAVRVGGGGGGQPQPPSCTWQGCN
jgi:hypothetical protein